MTSRRQKFALTIGFLLAAMTGSVASATAQINLGQPAAISTPDRAQADLDFGVVPVGGTSPPVLLPLENLPGSAPIKITGFVFGGAQADDFFVGSDTCRGTLFSGGSCVVTLRMSPSQPGPIAADFTILSNVVTQPLTLSGQGRNFETGVTGVEGSAGPDGADGNPGSAGPTGAEGGTGPAGTTDGNLGGQGPSGPSGPIGPSGNNGLDGSAGDTGAPGPEGQTGSRGKSSPRASIPRLSRLVGRFALLQGRRSVSVLKVTCPVTACTVTRADATLRLGTRMLPVKAAIKKRIGSGRSGALTLALAKRQFKLAKASGRNAIARIAISVETDDHARATRTGFTVGLRG